MKHVVHKFFSIGAHKKEEQWLNSMAAKGLLLTDVGFCRYVFTEGTPGEYIYRLELLDQMPNHPQSMAYINFLEETGVEQIGSYIRWVYFRRKAADGPFELYSDIGSKIRHLRRITWLANTLSLLMFFLSSVWNRTAWLERAEGGGDSYLFLAGLFCLFAALCQLLVLPVRRSLRQLKAEQKLRE